VLNRVLKKVFIHIFSLSLVRFTVRRGRDSRNQQQLSSWERCKRGGWIALRTRRNADIRIGTWYRTTCRNFASWGHHCNESAFRLRPFNGLVHPLWRAWFEFHEGRYTGDSESERSGLVAGLLLFFFNPPSGKNRRISSLKESVFVNSALKVPCCQKYTPTDCFFRWFCPLGYLKVFFPTIYSTGHFCIATAFLETWLKKTSSSNERKIMHHASKFRLSFPRSKIKNFIYTVNSANNRY